MIKNFKFSIVIAIYNMEQYLTDTVESLLNQTIGFEDNLQILLVNDGSIDQSEKLCKDYVEKYPDNITYIWKENGGVSEARNKGLEYASGELINFLDADDKLSLDALEKVYGFYSINKEEVDLISIPLHFFEGKEGEHVLNGKFSRTRVIDIFKEPKCFQMHISSSFIKLEIMKQYSFNSLLKFGEDAEVANKIILNKGKYGVVADTKYWYRQRNTGNSAIQGAKANKENYTPTLKYLHLELIRFAKELYQEVPLYLQWMLVYDLGWKIRVPYVDESVLNPAEIEEFLGCVKHVLEHIDDEVILANSYLKRCYYMYMLNLKYNVVKREQLKLLSNKEEAVLCKENQVIDMLSLQTLNIESIEILDNKMYLSGDFYMTFDQYDFKLIIEQDGVEINVPYQLDTKGRVTSLNQVVKKGYGIHIEISMESKKTSLIAKVILGDAKVQMKIALKQGLPVENNLQMKDYIVKCKGQVLEIENLTEKKGKNNSSKNAEDYQERKEISSLIKLYKINRQRIGGIGVFAGSVMFKQLKALVNQLTEKEILYIPDNRIPFSYRYFLLKNLKFNGKYDLNIATIYNQAFLYNNERVIVRKGTDITIEIDDSKFESNQIYIKGSVASPFPVDTYQLYCNCNKQSFVCEVKKNNCKAEKWFGQIVLDNYEFEIPVPLQNKNEIDFVIGIDLACIPVKLKISTEEFIHKSKKAGFVGSIKDKKKLELFII